MIAIVVIEMFEVDEEFKVPPWGFGVGMLPWMRGSRKRMQITSDVKQYGTNNEQTIAIHRIERFSHRQ